MAIDIPAGNQEAQFPERRIEPFSAPGAGTVNFDPLSAALRRLGAQQTATAEMSAQKRAREDALQQQAKAGAGTIVPPDANADPRYQETFQAQARAVHLQQVETAGHETLAQMRQQYQFDPNGFQTAYINYVDQTSAAIAKQDPAQAAAAKLKLQALGVQSYVSLVDQKGNFDRQEQSAAVLSDLDARKDTFTRQMLGGADEESYLSSVQDMQSAVRDAAARGTMSPAHAESLGRKMHEDLTQAWVIGTSQSALERGDIGAIAGLEKKLMAGAYFNDPKTAQAAGHQLASQVRQYQAQARQQNAFVAQSSYEELNGAAGAIAAGIPVDPKTVDALLGSVRKYADTSTKAGNVMVFNALRAANSAKAIQTLLPAIDNMSLPQLQAERVDLGAHYGDLSTAGADLLGRKLSARIGEFQSAAQTGNYLAPFKQLDVGTADASTVQQRRTQAAQSYGVSPDAIPLFSQAELSKGVSDFQTLLKQGKPDAALKFVDNIAAAGGGPLQTAAQIGQIAPLSAPMYVSALLQTGGNSDSAVSLLHYYGAGLNADAAAEAKLEHVKFNPANLKGFSTFLQVAGHGDPQLMGSITQFIMHAYNGAVLQAVGTKSSSAGADAEHQIESLIKPIVDGAVTLRNGSKVPGSFLTGTTEGNQRVLDLLNQKLSEPQAVGLAQGDTVGLARIQPLPLGGGAIGFLNTETGRIQQGADGKPVVLNAKAVSESAIAPPGLWPRFEHLFGVNFEADPHVATTREAGKYATQYGVDPHLMEAIAKATDMTPPTQRSGIGGFNVQAHALDYAEVSESKEFNKQLSSQPQYVHQNPAQVAAAALATNLKKYGNQDEALAAYATDPATVDGLKARFGADWQKYLPLEAHQFVERVKNSYGAK